MQTLTDPVMLARTPVSVVGSVLEAAAMLLAYLAVLALWRRPVQPQDLFVVGLVTLLSFPGTVPFRCFSGELVLRLVIRWALLLLLLVALTATAAQRPQELQRPADQYFLIAWGLLAFTAVLGMHFVSPRALRMAQRLQKARKVIIVGVNDVAVRLGQAIASGQSQGQMLAGYFEDRAPGRAGEPEGGQRLGGLADVGEFARRNGVHRIYITLPLAPSPRLAELLRQTQDTTASVYFVPNISIAEVIQCRVSLLAGVPVVAVCETPLNGGYGAFKRTLDLSLTVAALPVLLPAMALIALLVRLTSPGPAIFKQRRYGLDGEEIMVWKFRTMTTQEDGACTYRQAEREDQRVTPLGRFLRRTSLDELPQFLNVLAGTMSIVGPRPHALAVNEQCRKLIPGYMLRHKVKPGITGWAQVNGHRGGDDLEALRKRTECDIHYLKAWSLGLDLLIIWKTAVLLINGDKNAY